MREFIALLIIYIAINPAFSQSISDGGCQASKLNMTLNILPNEIALNQEANIYFNLSNIDLGYKPSIKTDAKNITFIASLSKSLAAPKEEIQTKNNNCDKNDRVEICSSNFKSGDYALVKPDGTIIISLTKLSRNENIIIKYKTIYIKKIKENRDKICTHVFFDWDRKMPGLTDPFIQEIQEANDEIEFFDVNISPECNTTYQDDENCIMFRSSKVSFSSNLDNNKHNISYKDIKMGAIPFVEPINSGDQVDDLGIHQFSIEVSDSEKISYANSSRYYEVVDLIDYHGSLINIFNVPKTKTIYPTLFGSLIICVIILLYLRRIDPCENSKEMCKINTSSLCVSLENNNIKEKLFYLIILINMLVYYYYIWFEGLYKNMIYLEASAFVTAFAVMILSIYYSDKPSCKIQVIRKAYLMPLAFLILTVVFHGILPWILSNIIFYLIALVVFLCIALFIFGKLERGGADTINMRKLLFAIFIYVVFILAIIFIFNPIIMFKSKFGILELFMIELMDISFLILFWELIFSSREIFGDFLNLTFPQRFYLTIKNLIQLK